MSFRVDGPTHVGLWKNRLLKLTENMKECMSENVKMSDIVGSIREDCRELE